MTNQAGQQASGQGWHTREAILRPREHAGGFLGLELVVPAWLEQARASGGLRVVGTRLEVELSYEGKGLPPKTPCRVLFLYGKKSAKELAKTAGAEPSQAPSSDELEPPVDESPVGADDPLALVVAAAKLTFEGTPITLDEGSQRVAVSLELCAAGPAMGPLLRAGAELSIVLLPQHPHARGALVSGVKLARVLELTVGGQPGLAVGEVARVGQRLDVKLTRHGLDAALRFRVDTPGESDVTLDWAAGESGEKRCTLGAREGALALPPPAATKKLAGKLVFPVLLELVTSEGVVAPIERAFYVTERPSLEALSVEEGEGIRVVGTLAGFAPGFDPPFAVELWSAVGKSVEPVHPRRVEVPALGPGGTFSVETEAADARPRAGAEAGQGYFAVLRAAPVGFEPLGPLLEASKAFARFGDEDFAGKGQALGYASSDAPSPGTCARAPVLGALAVDVLGESVAALCQVLGPKAYWSAQKKKISLTSSAEGAPALVRDATYEAVPGSARGLLVARFPFKDLAAHAGKPLSLTVEGRSEDEVGRGAGALTTPTALAPRVTGVSWRRDDEKARVLLVVKTEWMPERAAASALAVSLGAPWDASRTFALPAPGLAGHGLVDDEGEVELSVGKSADELAKALEGGLEVVVARPAGKEALYGDERLRVEPFRGRPAPAPKGKAS
jgi:hypothetical protein